MKTRDISNIAILAAISVVIAIIESYFTFIGDFIPGLKLGLANIIVLFSLYKFDFKVSFFISIIRVILVSILRTGFGINFFFSLAGAIFSLIAMFLASKTKLSIIGVSIIGSICHSLGQVIVGIIFLSNNSIIYYLPYLLIFSIPTGIIIGYITKKMLLYTENLTY